MKPQIIDTDSDDDSGHDIEPHGGDSDNGHNISG